MHGDLGTIQAPDQHLSVGEAFIRSAGYLKARERMPSANVDLSIEHKATLVTGALRSGGDLVIPDLANRPNRLMVQDLLPSGTTDQNAINYLQNDWGAPYTPLGTAEGAVKNDMGATIAAKTATVSKVAAFNRVTDEFFSDQAAFKSYIDAFAECSLAPTIEQKIIVDINAQARTITGYPATATGIFDAIQSAIQFCASSSGGGQNADAIVISSSDWGIIRNDKGTGGNFQSIGPFGSGEQSEFGKLYFDRLFNLPVVIGSIPAKTILVGNFRQGGQVFYRENFTVSTSNSDQDNFVKNYISVRSEARLATAVYQPWVFWKITVA
jgi:HK97 family phage major capsid protein